MVELAALKAETDKLIDIKLELWANAVLLGEARERSNRKRSKSADRGPARNRSADAVGAAGEFVALEVLRRCGAVSEIQKFAQHMLTDSGGQSVKGPDFFVKAPNLAKSGIDVKTFDCSPWKQYFAINNNKHSELRETCGWYFSLLIPLFAEKSYISNLIPFGDVEGWKPRNLGGSQGTSGSTSRNMEIRDFVKNYCSVSPNFECLRRISFRSQEVISLANDNRFREEFYDLFPASQELLEEGSILDWDENQNRPQHEKMTMPRINSNGRSPNILSQFSRSG